MTVFRKRYDSDTWHFSKYCRNFPGNSCDEQTLKRGQRPSSGEICLECVSREKEAKLPKKRKYKPRERA